MIIIDTDILVWILRGKNEIKEKFTRIVEKTDGHIFITPVQIAEIYAGLKEKETVDTEIFLNSMLILIIDSEIGRLAGKFLNEYHKSNNVSLANAMIAGCIRIQKFKLWTLNRKHYPMLRSNEFVD